MYRSGPGPERSPAPDWFRDFRGTATLTTTHMAPPPRTRLDDAGPSAAAGGAAGEPGRMARLTRTAEAHMRAALAVARADEAEAPAHLARLVADAGAMLAAEIDNAAAGQKHR